MNGESNPISFAPNRSLRMGRFEFAVTTQDFALFPNKEEGAIRCPLGVGVELSHTDHNI